MHGFRDSPGITDTVSLNLQYQPILYPLEIPQSQVEQFTELIELQVFTPPPLRLPTWRRHSPGNPTLHGSPAEVTRKYLVRAPKAESASADIPNEWPRLKDDCQRRSGLTKFGVER
jgi:hypothetical protein